MTIYNFWTLLIMFIIEIVWLLAIESLLYHIFGKKIHRQGAKERTLGFGKRMFFVSLLIFVISLGIWIFVLNSIYPDMSLTHIPGKFIKLANEGTMGWSDTLPWTPLIIVFAVTIPVCYFVIMPGVIRSKGVRLAASLAAAVLCVPYWLLLPYLL